MDHDRPVLVRLAPLLASLFPDCERLLPLHVRSVAGLVDALDERWPGMRDCICDSSPAIRRHINVFVRGRRVGLGEPLQPGEDVFILTAQSLVRQDRDELFDVYDVRVGGGIALQNQAEPPVCQGESCAGAATPPPAVPPSGATASGPGNNPRLLCPKGSHRVRKKGRERCVRTKKHGRGKRPAGRNGRSGR